MSVSRQELPDRAACRLLVAAGGGNVQEVQQCLVEGTPATSSDLDGHTALHKSALMGFEHIAQLLLASDPACAHATDLLGNVPLHAAAFSGNVSIARCLLAARARVDPRDRAGNTPLHRAALVGNRDAAELLLAHGALATAAGSGQFAVFQVRTRVREYVYVRTYVREHVSTQVSD